MADPQFASIMATFLFDMSIFLVELLIFFCIRNKRDKGNVLLNWQPQNEYFREFNTNDLRPSMQKEVQREMKELEQRNMRLTRAMKDLGQQSQIALGSGDVDAGSKLIDNKQTQLKDPLLLPFENENNK